MFSPAAPSIFTLRSVCAENVTLRSSALPPMRLMVTWRRDGYVPSAHHRVFGAQADVRSLVATLGPLTQRGQPTSPRERKTNADAEAESVGH